MDSYRFRSVLLLFGKADISTHHFPLSTMQRDCKVVVLGMKYSEMCCLRGSCVRLSPEERIRERVNTSMPRSRAVSTSACHRRRRLRSDGPQKDRRRRSQACFSGFFATGRVKKNATEDTRYIGTGRKSL